MLQKYTISWIFSANPVIIQHLWADIQDQLKDFPVYHLICSLSSNLFLSKMPAFLHKIPLFCYSFRVSTQRILSYKQCRKHKFSIASFITGTSGMGGTPITGPSSQYAIKSSLLLEKLFLLTTTCKTAPLRSPNSIQTDLTRF